MKGNDRVLMVGPFHRSQRGNSLTTARIKQGLESRGFQIDFLSLEGNPASFDWQGSVKAAQYAFIHGFHALHFARFLRDEDGLQDIPQLLTTTGTDLHDDHSGEEKSLIEGVFHSARFIVVFHQDFIPLISQSKPALAEKIVCIPQGVALPEGSVSGGIDLHDQPDDFIFLLPSGLRPVKNVQMAIAALEKLQAGNPRIKLLIIGAALHPEYSQTILEWIKPLSWVKYAGEIPHEEMCTLIRQCDAVINCSLAEGQPQGALEAMSLGLPCILSAVPGNLNIIEHGKEGFYVHDEYDLLQAAQCYLNDPARTLKMGQAAAALVDKKFRLETELNAYADIYRQLIG